MSYINVHIVCIFQVVFSLCIYSYSELTYNRIYTYPKWAIGLGWMLACSSVIMIPLTMTFKILTTPGSLYDVSTILKKIITRSLRFIYTERKRFLSLIVSRGSKGGVPARALPGSKFFQFHAVFGKIWQKRTLTPPPPGELASPPRGNPGSVTVCRCSM